MGIDRSHKQQFNFPKQERLNSKKLIETVFSKGKSLFVYPFSIRFIPHEGDHHQFLISVSKKKFKRAVDRNLIKRRVKEAYRLNKAEHLPLSDQKQSFLIAYIYIAKEIHDYKLIESKLIDSLKRLHSKRKSI